MPDPLDGTATRLCRIELQIERRRLGGALLLARQLPQAIRKRVGYTEFHVSPGCVLKGKLRRERDPDVISEVCCDGGCDSIRHLRIEIDIDFRCPDADN